MMTQNKLEVEVTFCKNVGKFSAYACKKSNTNVIRNPGKPSKTRANNGSAKKPRNPEEVLSTIQDVIFFIILLEYYTLKSF